MQKLLWVVMLAVVVGCGPNESTIGGTGTGGGRAGGSGATGGSGGSGGSAAGTGGSGSSGGSGGAGDGCSDDAKTVYVVSSNRLFSAFDPRTKTFRDIGVLNCEANFGAQPFSMAVARDAFAYVLYDDGELFRVSTNNLACTKTAFAASTSYKLFGMGFSADAVGGTTDTLFISGGLGTTSTPKLARLDVNTFMPSTVGNIVGWPELTGTGDAQLWGFFPDTGVGTAPFVARIDKTTGAYPTTFPAGELQGMAEGWAFAFWGGSFWIFLKRDSDQSTKVYEMKAGTGVITTALGSTGRTIVGAGVSTCAPITIN
ncbi:MAG: hypothetical protein IPJ65_33755 [Archangiaceae bacterium]|nr:hypothetical protein [Archangiaceae bacterium]